MDGLCTKDKGVLGERVHIGLGPNIFRKLRFGSFICDGFPEQYVKFQIWCKVILKLRSGPVVNMRKGQFKIRIRVITIRGVSTITIRASRIGCIFG